jgi:hypothetical protein
MIAGDFNMIRYSHEKNNANFRLAEAEAFNQCVERLDRVFINLAWDEILPSTILSSLTRTTSDHVPLRVDVSTVIPKSNLFRFENYWVKAAGFQDVLTSVWACRTDNNDTSAIVAAKLKETRRAIREWRKQIPRIAQRETDCRIVINLLDRVEEARPLSLYQNLPSER